MEEFHFHRICAHKVATQIIFHAIYCHGDSGLMEKLLNDSWVQTCPSFIQPVNDQFLGWWLLLSTLGEFYFPKQAGVVCHLSRKAMCPVDAAGLVNPLLILRSNSHSFFIFRSLLPLELQEASIWYHLICSNRRSTSKTSLLCTSGFDMHSFLPRKRQTSGLRHVSLVHVKDQTRIVVMFFPELDDELMEIHQFYSQPSDALNILFSALVLLEV